MAQRAKTVTLRLAMKTLMRSDQTGYTLIEILIVIAIISIVAAVATLSIHFNHKKQMESLAHHLVSLILLSEEEAILHPAVLGLAFTSHTYQVYRYEEKNHSWQPLTNKVFRAETLPDKVQITLTIQDKIIPANGKPQLIISSSGDLPAFTIDIGDFDETPLYQVNGEENGNVYAK
jgi:general secretion pathway protein H